MSFTFLQEQAYEYLCRQILEGKLEYNVVYSEAQVAKGINCSRTPVKDALTRLQHDKYIDIIPSKGFILHQFTERDILSTFQMRVALESFCVISLMKARETEPAKQVIARLDELLRRLNDLVKTDRVTEFLEIDLGFHRQIVDFVENDDFHELYDSHNYRIENLAFKCLHSAKRRDAAYQEHLAILTAIREGGISECYRAVTAHNENTYQCDMQMLRKEYGNK